jgi:hypothetical protein
MEQADSFAQGAIDPLEALLGRLAGTNPVGAIVFLHEWTSY